MSARRVAELLSVVCPLGTGMSDSISTTIVDSEELLPVSVREGRSVAEALNQILSNRLGWPYRVRAGSAIGVDGMSTEEFSTLIHRQ
jgi:hypothetical protein